MARRLRTSRSGLELIKSFEGFRSRAAELPNGKYIIGYGHTASARAGLKVSRADAELILRHHDLVPLEQAVADAVLAPLDQNEFDALVSLTFNIGIGAFLASDVLARLNEGKRLAAAEAFAPWRKARIDGTLCVVDALVRRRAAEKALFLEHRLGRAAVPSALIRAELDVTAALMSPNERAVIVESNYDDDRATLAKPRPRPATQSDAESAPQAAARAVTDRLTRILGENGSLASGQTKPPPPPPTAMPAAGLDEDGNDGLSVEEITDAISALVGSNSESSTPESSTSESAATEDAALVDTSETVIDAPYVPDLPDLDDAPDNVALNINEQSEAPLTPYQLPPIIDEGLFPASAAPVIDDLEPLSVDDLDVQRAVAAHEEFEADARMGGVMSWLPFALLSLLGLGAVIYGAMDFSSTSQPGGTIDSVDQLRFGPLLMLGGGIIFIIAAYYLIREFLDRD